MLMMNEWKFVLRQPLVWLCILAPVGFTILLASGLATLDVDIVKQYQLNVIAMQMMVLPVLVGVLSPIVFLRDQHANMDSLIAVTPVSVFKRGFVRFALVFSLAFLIVSLSTLMMMCLHFSQLGFQPSILARTLFNSLFVLLPNAVLLTVIGFCVCHKLSSSLVNYVVFAVLWVGYLVLASLTGNPILAGSSIASEQLHSLFVWFDPFTFTAIIHGFSQPESFWNTPLIINRVVILLGSGTCMYYALHTRPNQKSMALKTQKKVEQNIESSDAFIPGTRATEYKTFTALPNMLSTIFAVYKAALSDLIAHPVTWIIFAGWPLIIFNNVASRSGYVEPFSIMDYTSIDVVNHYAFDTLLVLGTLLMLLWSWQVCTRGKSTQMAELIAVSPVKNVQLLISHLGVLTTMVVALLVGSFIGANAAQWFCGGSYQPLVHVHILLMIGFGLMLVAWAFVSVFHLCRSSKTAGLIITAILLIKFTPVMTYLGLTNTLWSLAWTPLQGPEAFWGYRGSITTYWPYMQLWLVAVVSLVIVACVFSYRGAGIDSAKISRKHSWLVLPVMLTGVLFVQLHMQLVAEKPLTNSHKREVFKAQYEQNFVHWQSVAQPKITHIDANVDFYPSKQKADFALTYTLTNLDKNPIKQVLVGRAGFYNWADIEVTGAYKVDHDETLNQAVFEFEIAMQPGEVRTLKSTFTYQQPKLWPVNSHQIVTPEFSYIRSVPLLPTVGYQANYELTDHGLRETHNLQEKLQRPPSQLFAKADNRQGQFEWTTLSSTVTTEAGHQIVSQGELVSQARMGGREIFDFVTNNPVSAIPTWVSVPYKAVSKMQNGVKLQVFAQHKAQPNIVRAIDVNLTAMADTLKWFSDNISPYKGKQLSLIGSPNFGATGYALPQVMFIEHNVGFRARPADDALFDQRYRRAVHETAHQWFGHDIGNGVASDRSFLVESMAKYVELVMIEQRYGKQAMQGLVDFETKRYEQRSMMDITDKVALIDATQSHDQYSRATIVFAMLRAETGDEPIVRALKSVWQEHSYPQNPANSMDFIRALKHETGRQHEQLITHLFLEK
ncbi:hypothetical protein HJP15_09955 [Pseudoalteromonas sp. NEC-BIFX-2020_002]|uniref:M1 family aminopeptidase n=1 Tax=Pseudoalteromonas sp. NEC-BIFX-2020_002 TaxID=2732353 RepID=UPI00147772C9|nr:M1 family aminopeptidase [Pseudoalteromonas sp. NEC-BIFX-2020_002]NNG43236.1 hypothetical protein [Pseudoalteromonas sp. NEC-BIFX-2020_002]